MLGVLEIEENFFKRKRFDAKYLVIHQVSYLLDACVHHTAVYPVRVSCHNPVYHYITASAVYLTRFITTCVDDISRMNSHCVYYVYYWKSTSTR